MRPENLQRATQWVKEHFSHTTCPGCGGHGFDLNSELFALLSLNDQTGAVSAGPVYPVVLLSCTQCGATLFVQALKAGVTINVVPHHPPVQQPVR